MKRLMMGKEMISKKYLSLIFLVLISGTLLAARTSTPRSGKSTVDPTSQLEKAIPDFEYKAFDPEYWEEVQEYKQNGNLVKIVVSGADIAKEVGEKTTAGGEGLLAVALGLRHLGFSFAASEIYAQLAKDWIGTQIGHAALFGLDDIAQNFLYDTEEIGHGLLNTYEFGDLHPQAQSFVSYHAAMYNLVYGFDKWSKREFARILPGTYWDYQNRYLIALGEVARGRIAAAQREFEELVNDEKTPAKLKNWCRLHLARLAFERADYALAHKLYLEVDPLPLREEGRFMLEKAWTRYYLKDYSKALGMLEALEAPYYDPSATPERYILRMIIYKQLCHYETVERVRREFNAYFRQAFKYIQNRRDLTKNSTLAAMALHNQRLQYWANYIHQLRTEREKYEDYGWEEFDFYNRTMRRYKNKDKEVQARLQRMLELETRKVAEELLDAEEQVDFMDYASKLDSLRVTQAGESRYYKSQQISYLNFDRILWPVQTEYWLDELQNFEVVIKSRCDVGTDELTPSVPADAPEEFK
jgi:hypothetical protein